MNRQSKYKLNIGCNSQVFNYNSIGIHSSEVVPLAIPLDRLPGDYYTRGLPNAGVSDLARGLALARNPDAPGAGAGGDPGNA